MFFHIIFFTLIFFHSIELHAKSFLPPSFRADYEQTIVKKISGKTKKVRGKVEYLYPGNIRLQQSEPEKVIWVSNPKTTWFYQAPFIKREPGSLREYPTENTSPSRIFDLLKGGLNSNKYYTVNKKGNTVELLFKKDNKISSHFQKAILTFNGTSHFKNLRSIKVLEKNDDPLELVFKSINTDTVLKPEHFIFKPPPNTRIERP